MQSLPHIRRTISLQAEFCWKRLRLVQLCSMSGGDGNCRNVLCSQPNLHCKGAPLVRVLYK